MTKSFHAKEYARGRWHVIAPDGVPVYDNKPYGNDKPIIFRDEDVALDFAAQCNAALDIMTHCCD